MRIALTNATLFGPNRIDGWLTGDFDGLSVTLDDELDGGPYLSIQPDATYEGRASGGGAYESFTKQGSDLVCTYEHDGVTRVHVVPFKDLP
jgi:hypothetical protein